MSYIVTHYGIEKRFTSIFAAMRYCIKSKNTPCTIWTSERPIWQSRQWIEKRQRIQAKKWVGENVFAYAQF